MGEVNRRPDIEASSAERDENTVPIKAYRQTTGYGAGRTVCNPMHECHLWRAHMRLGLAICLRLRYIALMIDPAILEAATSADPTPILIAPLPILRQITRPVTADDMTHLRGLLPGMFRAMYDAPGIGLAAPQIGLDLRFCLVDVADEDETRRPMVLINPEVLSESEAMAVREEGCLSLPNQYADVVRPESVRVRFRTLDGAEEELEADGLLATCLQHEIDHLDGILFVDHISALKRNMIMRRLAKEQRFRK